MSTTYDLVVKLNQKLRGWAEHYRKVTSQKTFSTISYHVWKAIWFMLCKDVNAYDQEAVEYFYTRNVRRSKSALLSGNTKGALAKFQKGYCPVCDMSLFNGEELEIHHILPRRKGGNHSFKNLKLLHKLCHKQVEYSKDGNLKAVWEKKSIILSEK